MERMTIGDSSDVVGRLKHWFAWRLEMGVWESMRGAHAFTRRFGVWGWGILVCLVVFLLAGIVRHYQMDKVRAVQTRLTEQLAGDTRISMPVMATQDQFDDSDDRGRLKAFDDYLLPHDDIPVVIQDLLRVAENNGLSIQRGEYRPQVDPVGGFLRYRMTLPLKGNASSIYQFIQSALRSEKTLALESVQFKREHIESTGIEARIQWVLLTRLSNRPIAVVPLSGDAGGRS